MKLHAYNQLRKRVAKATGRKLPMVKFPRVARRMNRNESRFNRDILAGVGTYEPTKFTITRTTERIYTPDFAYATPAGRVIFVEVKGSYRLGSEDRARLAWEISAESHPEYDFAWARQQKDGGYQIEVWQRGGIIRYTESVRSHAEFERMLQGVRK